jgi:hypothetical protein
MRRIYESGYWIAILCATVMGVCGYFANGCASPVEQIDDVSADVEPLTTCWNSTLISASHPPLDMLISARAMQSWQGGSWGSCSVNWGDTQAWCPRLVGTPQVVAYWNYCIPSSGPACLMSIFYDPDHGETNHLHGFQIWTTDYSNYSYTHGDISPASDSSFHSGTVDVTHTSGQYYNVHTCITQ